MEENKNIVSEHTRIVDENGELDLWAMVLRLWEKRRFILLVTAAFAALGLLTAILQKPVYTASCTFVPEKSSKSSSSSLSSLAAMAGVNLSDFTASTSLSPIIYPQLLQNVELNKELMRVPVHFKKYSEPVSLYDLATNPKYKKFSLIGTIKKYTIGLPGVIIGAIRGEQPDVVVPATDEGRSITAYTKDEYKVAKAIARAVSMTVEKKDGYIVLSAKTGEALASAEICQAALDLMQKYVNEFKVDQARNSLEFIQARYDEAKKDYEEKQMALARFNDSNHGTLTAMALTRREQLASDYNLAYSLFNEVAKQKLQAEMMVKEDTPVLAPVKPVSVPMQKSNSRSKTLAMWVVVGLLLSCCSVFVIDWLRNKGILFKS